MDLNPSGLDSDMAGDAIVIEYLQDRNIAKLFYGALCNMRWKKRPNIPEADLIIEKLRGFDSGVWSCSWRYAAGIIADIRNAEYNAKEDYMDFYCSGNEGEIPGLVRECFERMGWVPHPWEDDEL